MDQQCRSCGQPYTVSEPERRLIDKVSPRFGDTVYALPLPRQCPDCRQRQRLAFRNERNLYHRTCASTGKRIISIYSPEKNIVAYDLPVWWGDSWDGTASGREFDFQRPFFEQFNDLQRVVPRMALLQSQNENSAYTNCVSHLKDCYLMFSSDFSQDCFYGTWIERSKDCCDNYQIDTCELAYDCVFCDNIYASRSLIFCSQCRDSAFLYDCRGCSNCFMCAGLRNKQYYFENRQCTKEEYAARLREHPTDSLLALEWLKERFEDLVRGANHLYLWRRGRISDSSGDLLANTDHCTDCFEVVGGKDCRYIQSGFEIRDLIDCSYVMGELGWQMCECFPAPFQSALNLNTYTGSNLYYCDQCMNSCSNLFGCVGLKHREYCILNRQYSKEEYETLVPRIIRHMERTGEWGEFFPPECSLFAYNETCAQDEFPLRPEQAVAAGYCWKETDQKEYQPQTVFVPDSIRDVGDDILAKLLACKQCGKNYKVAEPELRFYRKNGVPVPRHCPDCRHRARMNHRSPRRLIPRTCAHCGTALESALTRERAPQVLCEPCYLKHLHE